MTGAEVAEVLTSHEVRTFIKDGLRGLLFSVAGASGVGAVLLGLLHRRVGRWAWTRLSLLAVFIIGWAAWAPNVIWPDIASFTGLSSFGRVAAYWLSTCGVAAAGPIAFALLLIAAAKIRRPVRMGRAGHATTPDQRDAAEIAGSPW